MPNSGSQAGAEVFSLPRRDGLNWTTTIAVGLFHVGAIAALFMFSWPRFWAAVFLYWIATGLGISMGYHRLHTHRGYKCPLWLEYFFAFCGSLSLEGGPIFWVAVHRIHHQKSDQPGDPHSPRQGGFFWSHMGWIIFGEGNHNNTKLMSKYAPDLAKHRFYVELNNWHWVPQVVLGVILLAMGGLPLMLWGVCLRVVFGLHATWLVNSATHMWGGRRFSTRDDSRNNWWVAALTFGEGWHNNHHAHPTSIRHGLAWYEIDHSWILVNILKRVGLASDLKVAKLDTRLAEREAA
ncbi:MAG TPA: fatty acid desaturase [Bryobacteraceae bacterium]|jgi:stearoyl-CoA desaturase (delta-9 desaturase)|nr:fatty acid desaturase [Bryobacteraceae bacterium]